MIKASSKSETKQNKTKKKTVWKGFADLSVVPSYLNKPTKTQNKTHVQT